MSEQLCLVVCCNESFELIIIKKDQGIDKLCGSVNLI